MSMPYGKYQKSRNAAWQCLLDNEISCLPVPVSAIARGNGIKIGRYSNNADLLLQLGLSDFINHDGVSVRCGDEFAVFYHDGLPPADARFTVAHELGHIFLGHLMPTVRNGSTLEQEADVFASRLLAPACILWSMDIHKSEDISTLCDIPMSSAKLRAKRMQDLYARENARIAAGQKSCFLLSSLERKVFQKFADFVNGQ